MRSRGLSFADGFEGVHAAGQATRLAAEAVRHYTAAYRRLAVEIPEFRLWSDMTDAEATRLLIGDVLTALPRPEQAVLSGLVRLYRARLDQPILKVVRTPPGLRLPTLAEGYIAPSGLVATAGPDDVPSTERWWETTPTTSVHGVQAFAIEEALYLQLGEQVTWPELLRWAGTALPVVMMDGFDELLQATGQNWADYLERLAAFQLHEAELGRPLAMMVTSRIVVADRTRFPRNTAVIRLEPFTDDQIVQWLTVWNRHNARPHPLTLDVVLAHRELAEQPLLLLLLALYDGPLGAALDRTELYERLFTSFFERQLGKFDTGLPSDQQALAVAAEWRLRPRLPGVHRRGRT